MVSKELMLVLNKYNCKAFEDMENREGLLCFFKEQQLCLTYVLNCTKKLSLKKDVFRALWCTEEFKSYFKDMTFELLDSNDDAYVDFELYDHNNLNEFLSNKIDHIIINFKVVTISKCGWRIPEQEEPKRFDLELENDPKAFSDFINGKTDHLILTFNKKLLDEFPCSDKPETKSDTLNDYLNYATSQPMRDGEEICSFLSDL